MNNFINLDPNQHQNLKVKDNAFLDVVGQQQVLNVNANEVAQMALHAPVFFLKNSQNGAWGLSALTSFKANANLLVNDGEYAPSFIPTSLKTYPFALQQTADSDQSHLVFREGSACLSEQEQVTLFEQDGAASSYLQTLTSLLKQEFEGQVVSHHFAQTLEKLDLLKMIDLNLYYSDGSVAPLKGFYTIDEAKLQALSAEQLHQLHSKGFLMVAHAILISIQQLNEMIKRHNNRHPQEAIAKLKIEVNRSSSVSGLN